MDRIDSIICRVFKLSPEDMKENAGMSDIPTWDSLAHMDLITALEAELGIRLTGDEIADMQSVGAIRTIVNASLAGR